MINEQILKACCLSVDSSLLTGSSHALCVDGTSAARKSSILAATNRPIRKVQWYAHSMNANTYFPSTIGYVASGLIGQHCEGAHFNDRSYLNPVEWRVLWRVMDDYYTRFGNIYPDETRDDIRAALTEYREIFAELRKSYFYHTLRKSINAIAIIDTNVDRCDSLRASRGEGSDTERSSWRFYTYMQNLMYIELYPSLHLDIAKFDEFDIETVTIALAHWLNCLLDQMVKSIEARPAPLVTLKLPVPKQDLCLINITTHGYRSRGRQACKQITSPDRDVTLADYMPAYLDMYESGQSSEAPATRPRDTDKILGSKSKRVRERIVVRRYLSTEQRRSVGDSSNVVKTVTFADAFDESSDSDSENMNCDVTI